MCLYNLQPSEKICHKLIMLKAWDKTRYWGMLGNTNENIDQNCVIYGVSFTLVPSRVQGILFMGSKELLIACCIIMQEPLHSWSWWGRGGLCSCASAQPNISLLGCPRPPPGPTALSRRCPGSWGQDSHGQSGWSRILSCGGSRSTPRCPTRLWCWMCQW